MNSLIRSRFLMLPLFLLLPVLCSLTAAAQEPNDMKTGSVLFFNLYTSNAADPGREDTQINITNTNSSSGVAVHLFAVDGSTCSVADSFLFLTQSQTTHFFASDFDPGVRGYLVAIAYSGNTPAQFNFLTGTAYIHLADGRMADLPAVAVARRGGGITDNGDGSVNLPFDGVTYERLPGTVALSNFNSQVTDSTSMFISSPRNLFVGEAPSISIFTLVFNELERSASTSFRIGCFSEVPLTSLRVVPGPITSFVPAGQVGWVRMSASRPLLGASLSRGPNFAGGRNLTTLSLFSSWTIIVPGSV